MDNNTADKNETKILVFYSKFKQGEYIEELKKEDEYNNLCSRLNETYEEILSNLPESKRNLLESLLVKYEDINAAILAEENKFCYINGFKESLQLIKEMI